MDLTDKIGQLFLLGFEGETLTSNHPLQEDLNSRNLGGVVLFERLISKQLDNNNIINASQVRRLTNDLQNASGGRLLIGIDQEGGKVTRLSPARGFPVSPTAAELGKQNDEKSTSLQSDKTAQLLKELGINFNLAPVVDINCYPQNPIIGKLERSFSPDPATVIQHASAWIASHKQNGILSCLKHFPGHGSSRKDSHLGFVDISETWNTDELRPFENLIKNGFADAIMTGHLFNSVLDPRYPATLSRKTLNLLLRKKLGFTGIIISDDMQMKAITDNYGMEEAIIKALAAGVDMIIIGNNLGYDEHILPRAVQAVMKAVERNIVTEELLDQSYQRVQAVKNEYISEEKSW